MLARTRRRVLLVALILPLIVLLFAYFKRDRVSLNYIESPEPTEEDCVIPPLELWPADLNQSTDQSQNWLDCATNGLRFTIEKPRGTVDIDSILPKRAWLEHGMLRISPENDQCKCDALPIFRLDEYRSVYGDPLVDVKSGQFLQHPQVMLLCQPRFNFSAWNADLLLTQRRFYLCGSSPVINSTHGANSTAVNILLLGIDSLSRLAWLRYMPKTVRKLTSLTQSRGAMFQKYHIVGDGTTSNLLALLVGLFEQELPESRRFASRLLNRLEGLMETQISGDKEYKGTNTTPLDEFPWIWKDFKAKAGYATHFIEDTPNWGTFQYRLQGFGNLEPPVDSYGRPCMVAAAQDEVRYGKEPGCTASTPTHMVLLESLREFFYVNSHRPRFSLTFLSEMIHEEAPKAQLVDADVAKLLEQIDMEDERGWGPFYNTLVVLFSDHGPRMGKARLSLQGKLEERLPMLAIILPRKFARDWPEAISTLQSNANRLCSPFDVHATLRHILTHSTNQSVRGHSLFAPLPWQRTCSCAGVARHWCTCAHWVTLKPNEGGEWAEEVARAAETTLETINAATRVLFAQEGLRLVNVCERLEVDKIIAAEVSRVPHEVASFRGTADRDGQIPLFDMPDAHSTTSTLRLHLRVKPKQAHFEVLLYRDASSGTFRPPSLANVRRLDNFEKHAKCLEPQKWSQARKLCICR
ncbi:hypothetical protein ECG_06228 [Echinococcus granulosus]|uniref:Sulfatase domain-containing protein n=1 Tax=Echinococcus granulosus TaxID=6210 RepID=A0A068WIV4_ECHGR|nr:hypothetical protein ECG_06228 [Echinococcus granulosus]CDS19685.1 protein of unknown function DUF229 [Echinococcus granulosus]